MGDPCTGGGLTKPMSVGPAARLSFLSVGGVCGCGGGGGGGGGGDGDGDGGEGRGDAITMTDGDEGGGGGGGATSDAVAAMATVVMAMAARHCGSTYVAWSALPSLSCAYPRV
jgi:hypothetical protein